MLFVALVFLISVLVYCSGIFLYISNLEHVSLELHANAEWKCEALIIPQFAMIAWQTHGAPIPILDWNTAVSDESSSA